MELVYLWVEEYKNIKRQGFNFSPRFRCEYDEKKKELIINENKDYVSIFPENINITAIVGENGSGKSSILAEILQCTISHKSICFFDKDTNTIYSNVKISDKSNISLKKFLTTAALHKKSFFYHLKKDTEYPILENNYGVYTDERNIFTEPNKKDNILNIEDEKINTFRKIINLIDDDFNIRTKIDVFFYPRRIELKKDKKIEDIIKTKLNEENLLNRYVFLKEKLSPKELILFENILYFKSLSCELKLTFINIKYFSLDQDFLSDEKKVREEINLFHKQIKKVSLLEDVEKLRKEFIKNSSADRKQRIKTYDELKKTIELFYNIDEIISLLEENYNGGNVFNAVEMKKLDDNKVEMLINLPSFLYIEIKGKNRRSYKDLSSGEKMLLEIVFSIRNVVSLREKNDSCENIFILLDEIENSLHPEWQKKIVSTLLAYLNDFHINIQVIIATHSPFILSDIPKENILFLEKGKQVYPFESGQTFGANIHTLLSHGFFMKDGLMGEFAKSKINETIKYLNQKVLTKEEIDYCENIISIIGEPLIKRQLQKMLDSKKYQGIESINKKIRDMEYELELLKKHQSREVQNELNDRAKKEYYKKKNDE